MVILHVLHNLLFEPIILLFEVIYQISFDIGGNPVVAVILLSIFVNLLSMPIYRRGDIIYREEKAQEKMLEPGLRHIKKVFQGDERFMMIQAYYRLNHYSPVLSLKKYASLLLQIPFFIAAYHVVSHIPDFAGMPFGPISDLEQPDGLLKLFGYSINVLPVLMTLINVLSAFVYSRGDRWQEQLRLYLIAVAFFILLYRSPACLLIYWMTNNLFSLVKNLVMSARNGRTALRVVFTCVALGIIGFSTLMWCLSGRNMLIGIFAGLFVLVLVWTGDSLVAGLRKRYVPVHVKCHPSVFYIGVAMLAVLTGVLIPSSVIRSSPGQFIAIPFQYRTPLVYILNALVIALGIYVVWGSIVYWLCERRKRPVLEYAVSTVAVCSIVNDMAFVNQNGMLTVSLRFAEGLSISTDDMAVNSGILITIVCAIGWVWIKRQSLMEYAMVVLILAVVGLSMTNIVDTQRQLTGIRASMVAVNEGKAVFTLSREKENVFVLMMDRAIGVFLPYIFQEKPELVKQYDGFTCYPNTLTYGSSTNTGAPGLFGGYEYTPAEMNKRSDELLVDKHNEALKVMPVMFLNAGYDVTVMDPPWAGYSTGLPDLSIYSDYAEIHTYLTHQGQFQACPEMADGYADAMDKIWNRNFLFYSLMKQSPLAIQPFIYQQGNYLDPNKLSEQKTQKVNGLSKATGVDIHFINNYSALCALPEMTSVKNRGKGAFVMMANEMTHEPILLKEPEYEPASTIDNTEYDSTHQDRFTWNGVTMNIQKPIQMKSYQTNMAAIIKLGDWFDYLRKEGVYDNTRIIIVSDHGYNMNFLEETIYGPGEYQDALQFNPILLVKDFNSTGFRIDEQFMTNADVPTMAVADVIPGATNPFTGKRICNDDKNPNEILVFGTSDVQAPKHTGTKFLPGNWFAIHGDFLKGKNWKFIGYY